MDEFTVREYMEKTQMTEAGDHILVGVSGGADSVCLLLVLFKLQKELHFTLEVVHVEHGIRGQESRDDAAFVESLCGRLGVVCRVVPVKVLEYGEKMHMGVEEAARELRYGVFRKLTRGKAKIALAHHMEDNSETVLFQMLRGSGLRGLCGMQPVRADERGQIYIRPLLSVSREEIEAYLFSQGQTYRVDGTNRDITYARNRLRHRVFPTLCEINPQAVAHINQSAGQLCVIRDYLEGQIDEAQARVLTEDGEGVRMSIPELLALHPALRDGIGARALYLASGHRKDITSVHIQKVLALGEQQSGRQIDLPYRVCARREFDEIVLTSQKETDVEKGAEGKEITSEWLKEFSPTGEKRVCLSDGTAFVFRFLSFSGDLAKIEKKTYTKWFDYDMIKIGFQIRHRQSGDFFYMDAQGHRKKLKQYMIETKIPPKERDQRWLIASGHCVVWLPGGRISETYKVTAETTRILEISFTPPEGKYAGAQD